MIAVVHRGRDAIGPQSDDFQPLHVGDERKTEKFDGAVRAELTTCDLFTMYKLDVDGKYTAEADDESFVSLLCLEGEGKVKCGKTELTMVKGESIFIPASSGKFTVEGKLEILESTL